MDDKTTNVYLRDPVIERELGSIETKLTNLAERQAYQSQKIGKLDDKVDEIIQDLSKINGGLKVFIFLGGFIGGIISYIVSIFATGFIKVP